MFLSTLDTFPHFLASADGLISSIQPTVGLSGSSLFLKATVFESTVIANDPSEAGEDGSWLRRMGSERFTPWPHPYGETKAWQQIYPAPISSKLALESLKQEQFHTLPFTFERARFVVPTETPPWAEDVIDEHYIKTIFTHFLGRAFCLHKAHAAKWRTSHIKNPEFLKQLGPSSTFDNVSPGRPRKLELAYEAYCALNPNGHSGPWKVVRRDLSITFGIQVSERTLQRMKNCPKNY
ncbi:hypothetical protein [Falsihalocynthiibacter sp. CO-5D18]|uniref:hypothetical protein n=1 Tax=Falsihalocynthiibacter sp. CO-5D18 TaxID=3240872 RepID=UPI00350F3C2A